MTKLFIAEKPSLAEAIAKALAKTEGKKAIKIASKHWEIGNIKVAWLFGHMLENAQPEAYGDYKRWSLDTLPIIPNKWKMQGIKGKSDHIKHLKSLVKEADILVNAGDAGREGQLLVDELIEYFGRDPFADDVKRMWVSSVLESDLIQAIKSLFPNSEKEPLYRAALARSHLDWLHGMNLTRLYTIKAQQTGSQGVVSVGRVQTPTLKLLVDRDLKIENFKAIDYFEPTVQFEHSKGRFTATWIAPDNSPGLDEEGRLIDENLAKEISIRVANKTGAITDFKSQKKKKAPPLLFNLSSLQSECSSKLKLTAAETLKVAQELYESKIISYPRSDSRYLPLGIYNKEASLIISNLQPLGGGVGDAASNANTSIKSAAWNDKKVSDHHAIIPTVEASAEKVEKLGKTHRALFELVAKQFLIQFYPDNEYLSLSATVAVDQDDFKASGSRMLVEGWRAVIPLDKNKSSDDQESQGLPDMAKGDPAKVMLSKVESKKTKPPARFSDGTLIAAMANIHKYLDETGNTSEFKKRLRESDGIGTEATRANIIETLLNRKFVERKGKTQLISTQAGRSIIKALPNAISDPALTAVWEGGLSDVASGSMSYEKLLHAQVSVLKKRVEAGKDAAITIEGLKNGKGAPKARKPVEPIDGHGSACPKCSEGKLVTRLISKGANKGKKFLSCDQFHAKKCDYAIFPETKKSAPKIAEKDHLEGHNSKCPKCEEGKLITRKSRTGDFFLGCNTFPKCKHTHKQEYKKKAVG